MRYIDADKLYEATAGGKDIFAYYYPNYQFGKHPAQKFQLRSEDKTASAQITYYNNLWRVTDFGNQSEINSIPGVEFVKYRENLQYYEALQFIEQVILKRSVGGGDFKRPSWRALYESREMTPEDEIGKYTFVYKETEDITEKDLEAIGRYVNAELLKEYNCRVLKYYEYCTFSEKKRTNVVHKFIATDDYPMFVFDYGDFQKIYKPHDLEKKNRFLYAGKKPKDYIYGLKQLLAARSDYEVADEFGDKDDNFKPKDKPNARFKDIFRCSGESDALNLASLGFRVYWLNSETAELTRDEYRMIDDMCESHYQIMDLDSTGRAMALRNAKKYIDLYTVALPDHLSNKRDFRGNPCKDLKDFINLIGENWDHTRACFFPLKAQARKVKFWYKNDKGDYGLNLEHFYFFIKVHGYYQIKYNYAKDENYCFVKATGKVVDMIGSKDIKREVKTFTREWIKARNFLDEIPLLNKLNGSAQISDSVLDLLDIADINFENYDRNTEYLHFKNGSFKVTKEKIERVKNEDIPNQILGSLIVKNNTLSHVIPHNVTFQEEPPIEVKPTPEYAILLDQLENAKTAADRDLTNTQIAALPNVDKYEVIINDNDFVYTNFLRDLSRLHWRKEVEYNETLTDEEKKQEMLSLANIMFCIGYLCAQNKTPSKPWMVFIQDNRNSEIGQASGRSGKSLITEGLKHVRVVHTIDGKKVKNENYMNFVYDGYTKFHNIVAIDDFDESGDFAYFYSQITGDRHINGKHASPFTLPYRESGKMVLSTNYELPNTDSSTMARLLNCGVSDYYHEMSDINDYLESRSPRSKYGMDLYSDFTEDEWSKFYNFIAYCIQLQMRFHRIDPPMENLHRRQLRRKMSYGLGKEEVFLKWANDYFRPLPTGAEMSINIGSDFVYLDTKFNRQLAFADFMENSGISDNQKKNYTPQRFKGHLVDWAKYNGYIFNPVGVCTATKDKRILVKVEGKTIEYFYISTKGEDVILPDIEQSETSTPEVEQLPF